MVVGCLGSCCPRRSGSSQFELFEFAHTWLRRSRPRKPSRCYQRRASSSHLKLPGCMSPNSYPRPPLLSRRPPWSRSPSPPPKAMPARATTPTRAISVCRSLGATISADQAQVSLRSRSRVSSAPASRKTESLLLPRPSPSRCVATRRALAVWASSSRMSSWSSLRPCGRLHPALPGAHWVLSSSPSRLSCPRTLPGIAPLACKSTVCTGASRLVCHSIRLCNCC